MTTSEIIITKKRETVEHRTSFLVGVTIVKVVALVIFPYHEVFLAGRRVIRPHEEYGASWRYRPELTFLLRTPSVSKIIRSKLSRT